MDEKELLSSLFNYFYSNPDKEVADITEIVEQAHKKASKEAIPSYKPRVIKDLSAVPDEYDSDRKEVKQKKYQDESTFDSGDYD